MPPVTLPLYFVWIDSIVYVKYGYMGLMLNEFTDREGAPCCYLMHEKCVCACVLLVLTRVWLSLVQ